MVQFDAATWAALALAAGAGVLGVLHTLARTFAHERQVHDLKLRVVELKTSYAKRLAEMQGRSEAGVVVVKGEGEVVK